jgi:hypothetical protein
VAEATADIKSAWPPFGNRLNAPVMEGKKFLISILGTNNHAPLANHRPSSQFLQKDITFVRNMKAAR